MVHVYFLVKLFVGKRPTIWVTVCWDFPATVIIYFNFVPGFNFCYATSAGSSSDSAMFLTYGTSGLRVLSCCSYEVGIKHLSVSLGLFSSLTDLLIMSAKEIVRLLHVRAGTGRLRKRGAAAQVAKGQGGGGCLFWRSCQGVCVGGMGEAREGGGCGREAVGSG